VYVDFDGSKHMHIPDVGLAMQYFPMAVLHVSFIPAITVKGESHSLIAEQALHVVASKEHILDLALHSMMMSICVFLDRYVIDTR
jgi:hypothetical protein